MNLNLAFYTYFYGSNNNCAFMIPEIPSNKYNCYYFTNNKKILELLNHTKWIGIYDDIQTSDDQIESNMVGKYIKTCPQEYELLKEYDYLCFLDSKLQKINEIFVEMMINEYFINKNYALLLRKHWFISDNVWNEYNESIKQHRYFLQKNKIITYIKSQLNSGLSETTKHHCACGFLIRNMKHEKINEINKNWYSHIQDCGIQDQISFFFVKQLFNDEIHPFTENPFL